MIGGRVLFALILTITLLGGGIGSLVFIARRNLALPVATVITVGVIGGLLLVGGTLGSVWAFSWFYGMVQNGHFL